MNIIFIKDKFDYTLTSRPNNSASALPNLDDAPNKGLIYLS